MNDSAKIAICLVLRQTLSLANWLGQNVERSVGSADSISGSSICERTPILSKQRRGFSKSNFTT
jgi:hypothetical protein